MQERFIMPFARLLAWRTHRVAGALMAKAAYEPLDEDENALLERICKKHPALAEEKERYASFARNFTLASEELPIDLSARVCILLEQPADRRNFRTTAYATAAAVVLLLLSVYLVFMYNDGITGTARQEQQAQVPAANSGIPSPDTLLAEAMSQACGVLANRDAASAALLLDEAIREAPQAPYVGEALLKLADLEYNNLQRYENAYQAYDRLSREYPEILATSHEGSDRYDLLSEVRRENYNPLYVLDFARSRNADAFPIFEKVVATYPDTMLANAAVNEMRTLVKVQEPGCVVTMAEELERVKSRCSNPIAMAQVDLTLGHHYCNTVNDRERALAHYSLAAASDHVALAHEATAALSRMK